jgi:hypothetical protein
MVAHQSSKKLRVAVAMSLSFAFIIALFVIIMGW